MSERIIDIVIWLVSEIKTKKINKVNINKLIKQGYSKKEISTAFSWVVEKFDNKVNANESMKSHVLKNNNSFRYLHDIEKTFFSKDALGNIIQLQALGLISNEHIDLMIERALLFGYTEINSDMVKQYIATFMFDVVHPEYVGSRISLTSFDSIN